MVIFHRYVTSVSLPEGNSTTPKGKNKVLGLHFCCATWSYPAMQAPCTSRTSTFHRPRAPPPVQWQPLCETGSPKEHITYIYNYIYNNIKIKYVYIYMLQVITSPSSQIFAPWCIPAWHPKRCTSPASPRCTAVHCLLSPLSSPKKMGMSNKELKCETSIVIYYPTNYNNNRTIFRITPRNYNRSIMVDNIQWWSYNIHTCIYIYI